MFPARMMFWAGDDFVPLKCSLKFVHFIFKIIYLEKILKRTNFKK